MAASSPARISSSTAAPTCRKSSERSLYASLGDMEGLRRRSELTLCRGGGPMPVDLNALVGELADSGRARTPLSRLNFLRQVATEEELTEFFTDLLVMAAEGKHTDRWGDLVHLLEEWEDRTLGRLAASATFPAISQLPWTPLRKPV